jgi:hypothetical protein
MVACSRECTLMPLSVLARSEDRPSLMPMSVQKIALVLVPSAWVRAVDCSRRQPSAPPLGMVDRVDGRGAAESLALKG